MTIIRDPLDPVGVMDAAINQAGGKAVVAALLGNKVTVTDLVRTDDKRIELRYGQLRTLVLSGGVAIAEDFARLAGMQLVPLDQGETARPLDLMRRFSALMTETGEAVQTGATAIADGQLSRREIIEIRRQLLDVITEANGLLGDLNSEGGGD